MGIDQYQENILCCKIVTEKFFIADCGECEQQFD